MLKQLALRDEEFFLNSLNTSIIDRTKLNGNVVIKSFKEIFKPLLFKNKESVSFKINNHHFSNLCLLSKDFKRTLSKVGRLSWFALLEGQPVKIYECHNESHAMFIEEVSKHFELHFFFPRCLIRDGSYLVVQWIEGEQVTWRQIYRDDNLFDQVAKIQTLLHEHKIEFQKDHNGFSYIDYLKNRLNKFKGILPLNEDIRMIFENIDEDLPHERECISHPDLTANNMIIESDTGQLKIIDNELLTQNSYFLIDLYNTYLSFGSKFENVILEPYLKRYTDNGGDLSKLIRHQEFYSALWSVRLIGSFLQAGKIKQAIHLSKRYLDGSGESHPIIRLAKQKFVQ